MREHIPEDSRIHYVITDGGDAPNIVPESAEVYYYVRNPKLPSLRRCSSGWSRLPRQRLWAPAPK